MNIFDWYADTIYGWIADIVGRITGVVPFPVGELLMYLTVLLVVLMILLSLLLIFLRKREGYRRFTTKFLKGMLIYAGIGMFIYVTNWLLPYLGTVLGQGKKEARMYSIEELRIMRNYVAESLNEACLSVERDEGGHVIYPEISVMQQEVAKAMQGISDEFPRLSGYYPPMKEAMCSDVLDWMGIGGYTYPYTMEVINNKYITNLYYPFLCAHEYSHHKGFYKENEAEFLAYLACSKSDHPVIRYSAYEVLYSYIDAEYFSALYEAGEKDAYLDEEYTIPA